MLCAVCVWMFQGCSAKGNHHDTYDDLVKAADLGCKICLYLQNIRNMDGADEAEEKRRPFTTYRFQKSNVNGSDAHYDIAIRSKASWLVDPMNGNVGLHISKPSSAPSWWPGFVQGVKRDLKAEPWNVREDPFGTRHIPKSTGDPEVMKLGLEWLEACQNHHSLCQAVERARPKNYFPKRLLDVGTLQSNQIRLVTTDLETPSQEEHYATLSHCWGKDPAFLRLTTENLPQLNTIITPQSLPQSFMDAILSCRHLKIRYLWIDSLCILQSGPGAEEDWQRHVNEMHTIYANCTLNIGIAHASSPEHGAFIERNASFIQTTFVCMPTRKRFLGLPPRYCMFHQKAHVSDDEETRSEDDAEPAVDPDFLCTQTETCLVTIFAEYYDYSSFVTRQALWKRGWVFQERLMAPRMILFGSDRIYWRCQKRNENEYLPHGLPQSGEMFDQHAKSPFTLPDVSHPYELSTENLRDIYDHWYGLVDEYSETDLTYPEKDKLVAMAAIARHFDRLLPGRYCAGIFKSDLHFGLLWDSVYDYKGTADLKRLDWSLKITIDQDRSHRYQAPTWSWASVNDRTSAPIRGKRGDWQRMADIEGVSIDLKDPQNLFGQVVSAELTISGNLMDLADMLEDWTLYPYNYRGKNFDPNSSDEKLYGLFILETVRQQPVRSTEQVHSQLNGVILAHVRSNTYQRRGVFEADGPLDGTPFPKVGYERRTVVIV
jgi:hypothetical protein